MSPLDLRVMVQDFVGPLLLDVAVGKREPWSYVVELALSPRLNDEMREGVRAAVQDIVDDKLPLGAIVEVRQWV